MRHRLKWFIHLWAQNLRKGDEYLVYTPLGYGTVYIYSPLENLGHDYL